MGDRYNTAETHKGPDPDARTHTHTHTQNERHRQGHIERDQGLAKGHSSQLPLRLWAPRKPSTSPIHGCDIVAAGEGIDEFPQSCLPGGGGGG